MDLPTPTEGIRNCHAVGVDSLVLKRWRGGGMLRMFVTRPGHGWAPDGDRFPLAPHDHRFRITLRHLFGDVRHRLFAPADDGRVFHRYRFTSAMGGTTPMAEREAVVRLAERVEPLAGRVCLDEMAIHTVDVTSEWAAWLVFEGVDRQPKNALFSPDESFTVDASGLYQPMSKDEIGALWDDVRSRM